MKSSFKLFALLAVVALIFTGCTDKIRPPSASDTLGGTGWGAPSDVGDAGADLGARGSGIDADLMNRIKNGTVNPEDIVVTVYFDFDQYGVRSSERGKLSTAASTMQSNQGLRVVAVGYTDWYGTEQYNLALAERRALAVKDYLANLGIPDARVEILSMGKMQAAPSVEKNSPEAQHDRRVDLIKMSGGSSSAPAAAAPMDL